MRIQTITSGVAYLATVAMAIGAMASAAHGQPLHDILGRAPGNQFGWAVSGAGDVNRDGVPDFVVGAPMSDAPPDSGSVRVFSGDTGNELFSVGGPSAYGYFGYSVSDAGDIDRDGHGDIIVGAPDATGPGKAYVISGRTRGILYTFSGNQNGDRFGASVSHAGDINRDGNADVIVGAPGADFNPQRVGTATIFSGANGAVLRQFTASAPATGFGFSVSSAGDVNRDNWDDVIVGAPYDDTAFNDAGQAQVYSGRNGRVLYSFEGETAEAQLGCAVSGAGDVDRDNHADVIVGARFEYDRGRAQVFKGVDGSLHHVYWGVARGSWFGGSVSDAGDMDNDGFDDVLVGSALDGVTTNPTQYPIPGACRAVSGFMGSVIHEVQGPSNLSWFGLSVSGVGDVNNDGYADFVVGTPLGDSGRGNAQLFSGSPVGFATRNNWISLSRGGTQDLSLRATVANSGQRYWVLGTASGTTPGTPLGAVTLPLNLDPYLAHTVTAPNVAPLVNSMGTLDAQGNASVQFTLPAGCPPALLGLKLHHSGIVFDANTIRMVTNPVAVTLLR